MSRDRHWIKISDPDQALPHVPAGADVRILLPTGGDFDPMADKLVTAGAKVRRVRYLLEDETVEEVTGRRLRASWMDCHLSRPRRGGQTTVTAAAARPARDAFAEMWHAYDPDVDLGGRPVPIEALVPADWARFFPHPTLNPAQAQALPEILHGDDNLVVVAPTGAGKTVIGMAAALRTIQQGRKSAWLVPQRTLTDELDRELELWRRQGLRVERLSGEHTVDAERIRRADLWVSTTEKFEAICRASALRDALAEVGSLVVDEVHLLGDGGRGAVLEALLARMRHPPTRPATAGDAPPPTRLVGLSATVSNGEQLAAWLHARLLRVTWRPTRLTWQLLQVPAHADWNVTEAYRTRLAAAVTARVTDDGGSVLVFCGSKRTVRRMGLVIAASRGVDVYRVHPEDSSRVNDLCRRARVGLHYKGWEYRHEAEAGFRDHTLDVLVATSTVAAGVNLPARAVIVRDVQLGLDGMDVATVQQMFGRAGRTGAGENEGWAFLIVDGTERAAWQARLAAGHSVRSQILSSLPEHILGEAVQQRIRSLPEAEHWWVQTLAYHQGNHDPRPLRRSIRFLANAGMLARAAPADSVPAVPGASTHPLTPTHPGAPTHPSAAIHPDGRAPSEDDRGPSDNRTHANASPADRAADFVPTELGRLTARLMVSPTVGNALRTALAQAPVPTDALQAERMLIAVLAAHVPKLAQAMAGEEARSAVARILADHPDTPWKATPDGAGPGSAAMRPGEPGSMRGDLARAALLALATEPGLFGRGVRSVAGIPYAAMYPVLEEAPRYLHWIGCQGLLGTIHPWCAVVAADLGRRVRWRHCRPARGAGRLLWMCEQMATSVYADDVVPRLWKAARAGGYTAPDWPASRAPRACQLDAAQYRALLRERATGCTIVERDGSVTATAPSGAVLVTWTGAAYHATPVRRGSATAGYPPGTGPHGAAVFTWRGDHRAAGWLDRFQTISG